MEALKARIWQTTMNRANGGAFENGRLMLPILTFFQVLTTQIPLNQTLLANAGFRANCLIWRPETAREGCALVDLTSSSASLRARFWRSAPVLGRSRRQIFAPPKHFLVA